MVEHLSALLASSVRKNFLAFFPSPPLLCMIALLVVYDIQSLYLFRGIRDPVTEISPTLLHKLSMSKDRLSPGILVEWGLASFTLDYKPHQGRLFAPFFRHIFE